MNNGVGQQLYKILKSELSEVTARTLLSSRCQSIGKDIENLTSEDIRSIESRLLSSVLLFGGEEKAKAVKEKIQKLH